MSMTCGLVPSSNMCIQNKNQLQLLWRCTTKRQQYNQRFERDLCFANCCLTSTKPSCGVFSHWKNCDRVRYEMLRKEQIIKFYKNIEKQGNALAPCLRLGREMPTFCFLLLLTAVLCTFRGGIRPKQPTSGQFLF
eukprot:5195295-Amphidinium_carterae.1